ncbi:hypothetical protein [Capnocytophaga sp.]|uniref:hypothetical protein n=1 Tax=Capnocytophaga sp. TaxID=44737 RepID=UPI0026DADACB|nr:hypothetical protein [Capnocytophaga sp.]MDO5105993.1 hypothetical protein [Capnocytophaga sp.]
MKRILFLTFTLVFGWVNAQNGNYSVEFGANFGITNLTDIKQIDSKLTDNTFPVLSEKLNVFGSTRGGATLVLRRNRWGLLLETYTSSFKTAKNENKHYYNGSSESYSVGVLYDLIQKNFFTLSPCASIGGQDAEIFLDYSLKQGVTPTSLRITGNEADFTFGTKLYFRVASWKDNKWSLSVNTDAYYKHSVSRTWRLNNMLIDSENFNLSSVGFLVGLSIKYQL